MRRALLVLALAFTGCATRGTIRDLGHPEFEKDVPPGQKLTLVEPPHDGQFDAFPSGAGDGDYRCVTRQEIPAHLEGENVVFDLAATPKGATRIELLQVLVYPLAAKEVMAYRLEGKVPDPEHPVAAYFNEKKFVPGTNTLRVDASVPLAKVAGADQLAVPTLLRFEDGWVTIVYNVFLLPRP